MIYQVHRRRIGRIAAVAVAAAGLGASAVTAEEGSYSSTGYVETDYVDLAITTVAGDFAAEELGDGGPALDALLEYPVAAEVGADGRLYIVDGGASQIRVVDADGTISTFAGTGEEEEEEIIVLNVELPDVGDGGPAVDATLYYPHDIVFDEAGNAYISDIDMGRVRKVTPAGVISTYAGSDSLFLAGASEGPLAAADFENGDGGPATDAFLAAPGGLAIGPNGNLYIAEMYGGAIRMVDGDGIISTVAGSNDGPIFLDARAADELDHGLANAVIPDADDGTPAIAVELGGPSGLDFDADGNLYIAELAGRISRVDTEGALSTVAGGFEGRELPKALALTGDSAIDAEIGEVQDVVVATDGTVYFSTSYPSDAVYAIGLDGNLTLVAGSDVELSKPLLASAESDPLLGPDFPLSRPFGLDIDADDTLLIADSSDGQIHRLVLPDTTAPSIEVDAPSSIDRFGKGNKINFECSDNRPGVTCTGSVESGTELDTSAREGSVTVTAADSAGNEMEQVFEYDVNWDFVEEFEEVEGLEGTIARLYAAYFGRPPEAGGLEYWTEALEADPNALNAASSFFAASPEFDETYGSLTNAEFVELIYRNVMGREVEPGGFAFWLEQLEAENYTRGEVMLFFSQSGEFKDLTGSA